MVLCRCRNMAAREPRTMCLGCLHADIQKAPFDAEKWKGDLEPDQSIMPDDYYKCALRHAIFTEVLRRRNVAHSIVRSTVPHIPLDFMKRLMAAKGRHVSAKAWDKEGPRVLAKDFKDFKTWFFTTLSVVAHLASFEDNNCNNWRGGSCLRTLAPS